MALLSRILVPVEFSPRCMGSAQYAEALARHFHCELVFLHVVRPPFTPYTAPDVMAYSNAIDLGADMQQQARTWLEAFLAGRFNSNRVAQEVLEGDPARTIVEYARDGGFDLIVMPTHGYGPFRRFLLGSVTAKVLHDAACPVWTGPHMETAPAYDSLEFRKILCAIDLEPESRAVLGWAGAFAQEFSGELHIVHAIATSERRAGGWSFDPDWRADVSRRARGSIEQLQNELQTPGDVSIEIGEPPEAIREAAGRLGADLVVIGRGRPGLLGRLRTNAYAILRESPCPVVAI